MIHRTRTSTVGMKTARALLATSVSLIAACGDSPELSGPIESGGGGLLACAEGVWIGPESSCTCDLRPTQECDSSACAEAELAAYRGDGQASVFRIRWVNGDDGSIANGTTSMPGVPARGTWSVDETAGTLSRRVALSSSPPVTHDAVCEGSVLQWVVAHRRADSTLRDIVLERWDEPRWEGVPYTAPSP